MHETVILEKTERIEKSATFDSLPASWVVDKKNPYKLTKAEFKLDFPTIVISKVHFVKMLSYDDDLDRVETLAITNIVDGLRNEASNHNIEVQFNHTKGKLFINTRNGNNKPAFVTDKFDPEKDSVHFTGPWQLCVTRASKDGAAATHESFEITYKEDDFWRISFSVKPQKSAQSIRNIQRLDRV